MSYQYAKITNLDVTDVNGQPFSHGGITLQNNTANSTQVIPFQPTNGTTTTLNTNAHLMYNPNSRILYSDNFQQVTGPTILASASVTLFATTLQSKIIQNTYSGGAVTYTLDTSTNITALFQPLAFGSTFSVFICNTGGVVITIVAGDGSTTVNGTPGTTSFTMYFVYQNPGWEVYF
jgi:hypothetical protein